MQGLIAPRRLAELGPGEPNGTLRARLDALSEAELFAGRKVVDRNMSQACRAGLWLYHDFLDRSHAISQHIETPSGSYWHALMHRREGDYSNSKYWFHQVGSHPVFEPLAAYAASLSEVQPLVQRGGRWDPFRFVDLCQRVIGSGSAHETLCREIQHREWELLFDFCFKTAVGEPTL